MLNRKRLFLLLLCFSWIVLSAQTPDFPKVDSSKACYTKSELQAIAGKLIDGAQCDTALKVARAVIVAKDTVIASQKRTIAQQDTRNLTSEHLTDECETDKTALKADLKAANTKIKWIKAGWITTTIAETILLIWVAVKP